MPLLLRYIPSLYHSGDDNNGEDEEEGRARKSWEVKRNVTVGKKSPGRRWKNMDDGDGDWFSFAEDDDLQQWVPPRSHRCRVKIMSLNRCWWLAGRNKGFEFCSKNAPVDWLCEIPKSIPWPCRDPCNTIIIINFRRSDLVSTFEEESPGEHFFAQTWTNKEMDVQGAELNLG